MNLDEVFSDVVNPELYRAVHETAERKGLLDGFPLSEETHVDAIRRSLGCENREGVGVEEVTSGYDREQIGVDDKVIDRYVDELQNADGRTSRQRVKDNLVHSHLNGHEIKDYDIILQGVALPDKDFVPFDQRDNLRDVRLPDSRIGERYIIADFIGIDQENRDIRAVRVDDEEEELFDHEKVFRNARSYIDDNYPNWTFRYEQIASHDVTGSPLPPQYEGNLEYSSAPYGETEELIDDLSKRDLGDMHVLRRKVRV